MMNEKGSGAEKLGEKIFLENLARFGSTLLGTRHEILGTQIFKKKIPREPFERT